MREALQIRLDQPPQLEPLLMLESHLRQLYEKLGSGLGELELCISDAMHTPGSMALDSYLIERPQCCAVLRAGDQLLGLCASTRGARSAIAAMSSLARLLPEFSMLSNFCDLLTQEPLLAKSCRAVAEFRSPAGTLTLLSTSSQLVEKFRALAVLPSNLIADTVLTCHLGCKLPDALFSTLGGAGCPAPLQYTYPSQAHAAQPPVICSERFALEWSCGKFACALRSRPFGLFLEYSMESLDTKQQGNPALSVELRLGSLELTLSELSRLREGRRIEVKGEWPLQALLYLEGKPWRHCTLVAQEHGLELHVGGRTLTEQSEGKVTLTGSMG